MHGYTDINHVSTATPEVKRDFIRENTKQIKTMQKSNRESESAWSSRESLKTPQKTDRYEHVESKVAQEVKVVGEMYFCGINFLTMTNIHHSMVHLIFPNRFKQ